MENRTPCPLIFAAICFLLLQFSQTFFTILTRTSKLINGVTAKSADGTLSFDLAGKPQVVYYLIGGE